MYQFLFTGDNYIVSFIIGLLVLIGGYMLYDIAKKRIKPYIPLSVFIIVFGYGLSGWGQSAVSVNIEEIVIISSF